MTTNKTPIQELKKDLEGLLAKTGSKLNFSEAMVATLLEFVIPELLQKEKAFAFDCYREGYRNAIYYNDIYEGDPDFERFYSQYAEKHIS